MGIHTEATENHAPASDSGTTVRGAVRLRGGRYGRIPSLPFPVPAHPYALPAPIPTIPTVANVVSKTPKQAKTKRKRLISDHREI